MTKVYRFKRRPRWQRFVSVRGILLVIVAAAIAGLYFSREHSVPLPTVTGFGPSSERSGYSVRSAPGARSADCDIKGNISATGEKIYHVPGQRYYDATHINPARGERWFCSEWAAWWHGWRKARTP